MKRHKVKSAFFGYHGFPATVSASVNEEIGYTDHMFKVHFPPLRWLFQAR